MGGKPRKKLLGRVEMWAAWQPRALDDVLSLFALPPRQCSYGYWWIAPGDVTMMSKGYQVCGAWAKQLGIPITDEPTQITIEVRK